MSHSEFGGDGYNAGLSFGGKGKSSINVGGRWNSKTGYSGSLGMSQRGGAFENFTTTLTLSEGGKLSNSIDYTFSQNIMRDIKDAANRANPFGADQCRIHAETRKRCPDIRT